MSIKVFYRLISTVWPSKMPTRWYYHYCWVWSSILKVLKVISLQYLFSILKNEGMTGVHLLHADEHKVSTSWDYCFWWKWPDMSKLHKIESWWYFCKECCSCFCVLLWCKTFRCFMGVHPCLYCYILVSLHSQTRNFLPSDHNTIIKEHLCGKRLPSLFSLLQVNAFK